MAYKIEFKNNVMLVRYLGIVDGLDIVRHSQEPLYSEGLRRYKKVIYDYSHCEVNNLTIEDINRFATLAKIEAALTDHVEIVIVPINQESKIRAQSFIEKLQNANWHLHIADTLEQAWKLLGEEQQ